MGKKLIFSLFEGYVLYYDKNKHNSTFAIYIFILKLFNYKFKY